MDLRDIDYFAVIAEHGHLGRAAEALGLGQPALSISLRRLERAAETKLVKRTPKGVELTAVGSALLSHVRRLQLARADLAREVADLARGRAGHLRIGASPAISEDRLPEACRALLVDSPKVTLSVTAADNDALLPALMAGELDLAIVHIPHDSHPALELEPLGQDEFVIYCSIHHPLARHKSLLLADLGQERWASTPASARTSWLSLRQEFEARGLPEPQFTLVSDSVTLRHRVVAGSNLIGIASRQTVVETAAQFGLTVLRVKDLSWTRPVAVTYRKDSYLSPAAKRLIEILKAMAKEISKGGSVGGTAQRLDSK